MNDFYPSIHSIEPPSGFLSIKYGNKWKTISGDELGFPLLLKKFCLKIDSLIYEKNYENWNPIELKQDFFNSIKINSIIVYLVEENGIATKGYYILKGRQLRKFKKETQLFQKIEPNQVITYKKITDKYLILINHNLDIYQPNANCIMSDGIYYKNERYLWFIDKKNIIGKYLIKKNWR